jgi:hypothetical protein
MVDLHMAGIQGGSSFQSQCNLIELTPIWSPSTLSRSKSFFQQSPVSAFSGLSYVPGSFNFRLANSEEAPASEPCSDFRDLRYGAVNLDLNLAQNTDSVLRLSDVPADIVVMYWADAAGKFFFYFKDKVGNESEAPHFLPASARQISINNGTLIDLDQKRNRVSSMLMLDAVAREIEAGGIAQQEALILAVLKKNVAMAGENPNVMPKYLAGCGFADLSRDGHSGGGLSHLSWLLILSFEQLKTQETLLQDSIDPTSKVWLADVKFALAVKTALGLEGGFNSENSQLLSILKEAIDLTASAQSDCMTSFLRFGKTPDKETDSPFDAFDVTPYGGYGFGFYAGAYDQACLRRTALRWFHNAVLSQLPAVDILKKLGLSDLAPV